jgi:hypothetical protein
MEKINVNFWRLSPRFLGCFLWEILVGFLRKRKNKKKRNLFKKCEILANFAVFNQKFKFYCTKKLRQQKLEF